jgi:uncharacterized protein
MHDQIDTIIPFEQSFPDLEAITFNITDRCNLSCDYCWSSHQSNIDMSTDILLKVLDSIDMKKIKNINFFGGEPLLNWDVIKTCVLKFNQKRLEPPFGITSNLTLLTDEMIEFIDDFNIHFLVSIDGIKESHDLHRCNSYDIVLSNLKKLLDRDLYHLIEIRYTIHPDQVHNLFTGVKYLLDLGLNYINPCPVTDIPWTKEQLQSYQDNHLQLLEYYVKILETGRNISIKDIDDMLYTILEPLPNSDIGCNLNANNWIAISASGDVYPCHRCASEACNPLFDNFKIGNVFTGINTTRRQQIQKDNARYETKDAPNKCFECEVHEKCKLGCVIENLSLSNKKYQASDAYCSIIKILVNNIKKFRNTILNDIPTNNIRINTLKENLLLKTYFDQNIYELNLDPLTYFIRLDSFQSDFLNLFNNDILLPTFKDYFFNELSIIASSLAAFQNKIIDQDFNMIQGEI